MRSTPRERAPLAFARGPHKTAPLQLLDGVRWQGRPIAGERQQRLLAALAEAGAAGASTTRLTDAVWVEDPPADPARALQVVVSRTRSMTTPEVVLRTEGGYRLGLGAEDVDYLALAAGVERARRAAAAGDWVTALEEAEAAGRITAADRDSDDAIGDLSALGRDLLAAALRVQGIAQSNLGRHDEALPLLEKAVASAPDDDAVLAPLLRSLAAVSGAAAALDRYEEHRERLADRLGTDPGPELQRLHAELLAADRPVREGLRYDANDLVGRDGDLAALRALISSGRVTSIVGAGGLGKTRLANVLARSDSHPVVHVVELVGITSAEDLVGELGSALGVRDSVVGRRTLTPEQRADVGARIIQQLDTAPTLLVLDNCEHLIEAVADLVAHLVAGTRDLHVVTTSRAPLGIAAERVYQLGQLSTVDGVELFRQRATAARPNIAIDTGVVADLVSRLDGLPLAIELAAAKARVMSVDEISRRLENRFALLRGGDRSAPDRHQTLIAVIDWSWNLLAEPERAALRRLSVFHDGFSLDAAEQVLDSTDAVGVVQDLVDQSLFSVSERDGLVRFRMLETVREFGRMQLVDSGEDDDATAAQLDWAVRYVARQMDGLFGSGQFDAVDALRLEENNLADVLRRSLVADDAASVVQLFSVLASYWSILGDHARVIVLADAVNACLTGWDPPDELMPATRTALVVLLNNALVGAIAAVEPARDLLARLGPGDEPRVAGMATVLLTVRLLGEGTSVDEIEALVETPNHQQALVALQLLSHVQENAGDPGAAAATARRALAICGPDDGPWTAAILHTQLAQLEVQIGNPAAGVRHARQALPTLERLGASDDSVQLHGMLVNAAVSTGDLAAAEAEMARIEQLHDDERAFGGQLVVQLCRGELQIARGEVEEGVATYLEAARRIAEIRFPGIEPTGLEPWVLFGEATALTACAYHASGQALDAAIELDASCRRRLQGILNPAFPHLDFPVCGMGMFAIGAWRLLRGGDPGVAVRLLALADRFAYARMVPTMSWERIVAEAEERAPGALAAPLAEYDGRRGPDLLEEARAVVERIGTPVAP